MARTIVLVLALGLTGCIDVWGDWNDCSLNEARDASLDASGAQRVEIVAGAGRLDVTGVPGAPTVEVRGTACATAPEKLAGIELVAERRGDTLYIETLFAEDVRGQRRLDLVVEVPATLTVAIDDGSGAIDVRGVAAVSIEDGSGAIMVRDIAGGVAIDDGSGAMVVAGVGGDVRIVDGSGGIDIADVQGDVLIGEDGSGGIEIRRVGGNVVIEEDGSGGILAREIRGDFTLLRDGSGSVDVEADGQVRLP